VAREPKRASGERRGARPLEGEGRRRRGPQSSAGIPCFRAQGNRPDISREAEPSRRLGPAERRRFARFPCIFPTERDFARRDGFAPDCPHRQLVRGCRDFAPATRDHPRNSRAFAGSWKRGTAESEPETASSGPIAGSWSRLSLLPILAVRIRFRFAPTGNTGSSNSIRSATQSAVAETFRTLP